MTAHTVLIVAAAAATLAAVAAWAVAEMAAAPHSDELDPPDTAPDRPGAAANPPPTAPTHQEPA